MQVPPAHKSAQLLSVNCLVFGDDPNKMFTVEIPPSKNVSILKDLIKEKNNFPFPAKDLLLWKVSVPLEDYKNQKPTPPSLSPQRTVAEVFPSPLNHKNIHIIVVIGLCWCPLSG
jgi:hypothetical protein